MNLNEKQRFRISEEAALWLIRLEHDASPECRAEFTAWSRQSPQHVEEFLFAKATVDHFEGMDPQKAIDLNTLTSADRTDSIVPFAKPPTVAKEQPHHQRPNLRRALAAGLGACAVASLLALTFSRAFDPHVYSTAAGDQQTIKLKDGSVLHLNTRTRAEVLYTEHGRDIRLMDGEALFVVAHDPKRPFRVFADGAAIQAIGTQFNVYRRSSTIRVSVVEGAVRVASGAASDSAALKLAAGDEADITTGKIVKAVQPNIPRAVAWRVRRLVFEAEPLEKVLQEFNRYGVQTPIRLEGDAIRQRVVSGVFDADDLGPLVEFLKEDRKLLVTESEQGVAVRLRTP